MATRTKKTKTAKPIKVKRLDSPQNIDLPSFNVKISVKSEGAPVPGCETKWWDVNGLETGYFDMGDAGEHKFSFNKTNVNCFFEIRSAKGSKSLFDWIINVPDGIQQDIQFNLNLLKPAAR